MNNSFLTCASEQRRHKVRQQDWNGLDYLDVLDAHTLRVYFLGKAPQDIKQENVRITGRRRIQVVDLRICTREEAYLDDCMVITVDKTGDFSTYTLCVVELGGDGRPTGEPFGNFDPRYDCLDFSFKVDCPSDLDCKHEPICPPKECVEPEINYLAKDYASFRQLILDRLAFIMPDWQERHVPDLGVTLVEILAYAGDHLSYYQDAVATEAYLDTARQRISVRRHARLVDYQMHEGCNARTWVHVETRNDETLEPDKISFITGYDDALSASGRVLVWDDDLREIPRSRYEVFEPLLTEPEKTIDLYEAHNKIQFYTWGDQECCLPRGATTAILKDGPVGVESAKPGPGGAQSAVQQAPAAKEPASTWVYTRELHLEPGDVLIFEEVIGPKTGNEADADPARRHAVRLTMVDELVDELYHQPLLEIAWEEVDVLPFPFCISTIGPAPGCKLIEEPISVARGNVILVDHGRRVEDEPLGCVPVETTLIECEGQGQPSEPARVPGCFRPPFLQKAPLTFSQALSSASPASVTLAQDPRQALPWIELTSLDPDCEAGDSPAPGADDDAAGSKQEQSHPVAQTDGDDDAAGSEQEQSPPAAQTGSDEAHSTTWTAQRDLLGSNAGDPHFVVEMDNAGRTNLRFGDGELGQAPGAGAKFAATYRVGSGLTGNVGAEAISHVVSKGLLDGVNLKPRNPLPAVGGKEPEPLADVKLFAPHAFRRRLERAITADDYAKIVMRDFEGQVQRAAAVLRWTGSWYKVLVSVDPLSQVETEPTLDKIREHLYRYRRIGHDVVVKEAQYAPLDIEMRVCVLANYLRGHVKAALLALFGNRVLPDGRRGFFHPDNLTFGEGIYLSKLVATAQAVTGVESVSVTKLERLYKGPNGEIDNGILPLGPLEVARVDNDPSFPENGQFKLIMGGGR